MKFLLYKPLKINSANVLFWSDTHFNHKCEHWPIPLWKARGFSSLEEHNTALIERWNQKADSETTFFHLGDFILGYDSTSAFIEIIKKLNFKTLFLMPGNHCSGWKQVFEDQRGSVWNIDDYKKVIFIPNYLEAIINEQNIVMSHYPLLCYNGQGSKYKSICLYGHVHGKLIKNEIGQIYNQARTYEVCVENCPSPLSYSELISIFASRPAVVFDQSF